MCAFREIEHAADIGMEILAASMEEIFRDALTGFYALCFGFDITHFSPERQRKKFLFFQGISPEELLVTVLNQFNFELNVHKLLYLPTTDIKLHKITNGCNLKIECNIIESIPDSWWAQYREIKAVTYHDLKIKMLPDGRYFVRIIFDT